MKVVITSRGMARGWSSFGCCCAICLAALGCGDNNANWTSTDIGKVTVVVSSVGENAGNAKFFDSILAAGVTIDAAEREKLQKTSISVDGPVRFEKENAVVPVRLSDLSGQNVRKVEWTAVKEGEAWKLKSMPLK